MLSFLTGGVEPIAEDLGDGEEVENPQEMTKFIKKKPSRKVKKGRRTDNFSPIFCFIHHVLN